MLEVTSFSSAADLLDWKVFDVYCSKSPTSCVASARSFSTDHSIASDQDSGKGTKRALADEQSNRMEEDW